MRFVSLEVENFGVFKGVHRFDFTPPEDLERDPQHATRNIVLVRGHNGAGKSTLFSAFSLALHGTQSLGERVSRAEANEFLLSRLHRKHQDEVAQRARVALVFEYVESGRMLRFEVDRVWNRSGRVVAEDVAIRRNGAKPDGIKSTDYSGYLAELFPLNIAPISFFDAEKLDALSSIEGGENLLSATMRRLLGLDVVERLREDLDVHTIRQGGRELEPLRRIVFARQQELAKARAELQETQNQLSALSSQVDEIRAQITEDENKLSSAGGTYAQRRPQLLERRGVVKEKVEQLERELREMCEGLLPFALAPALCRQLETRLALEAESAQSLTLHTFWASQMARMQSLLQAEAPESPLGEKVLQTLREGEPQVTGEAPLHVISNLERDKLRGWLFQIADNVPRTTKDVTAELRGLRQELKDVENDLARAPEDDALAPIHERIARREEELVDATRAHDALLAVSGGLQFACAERERVYDKSVEEFLAAQKTRQKLALAERSKMVLRVYKDALTRNQVARLETLVAENFNRLCQKERLLRNVVIDPETFALRAQDAAGRQLGIADLSAGERQLYSLSLLWALRQISGRELPLLIDTPLGRLDEVHRDRLLNTFFPHVARQILLFTTTAEVDAATLSLLEPRLARHYDLKFNAHTEETEVESIATQSPSREREIIFNGRNRGIYIPLEVQGGPR